MWREKAKEARSQSAARSTVTNAIIYFNIFSWLNLLFRRCHSGNRCQLPAHGGRLVLTALLSLLAIGVCTSIRGEVLPGPEGLARKGQTSSTEQGLGSGLTDVPAAAAARGTPHPPSANAWHPDAAAQRLISCYNEQYATKLPYPTFDDLLNEELPRWAMEAHKARATPTA